VQFKLSRTGLTRSTLRWITLSFAGKKEGSESEIQGFPSLLLAVERGDEQSKVGVSKIYARQFELHPWTSMAF
jgi:hypothetical protein